MKKVKFDKKGLLSILLLILVLFGVNNLIFSSQLNYGFRDVDWEMIYFFKLFGNLSFEHLLKAYHLMGVYTYELYYSGFLEKLLGLNFGHLHQASQLFKIITSLSLYFIIAKFFKSRLLAFLSSIIYTVSYTHAGPLFQLSTGGYFFATIFMCWFFLAYYYSLFSESLLKYSLASFLLMVTLILNTERMYPLLFLVPLIELFYLWINNWKKNLLFLSLKRLSILFFPIILFVFVYTLGSKATIQSAGFAPSQFFVGTVDRIRAISNSNWQLLLYPFASYGSIFLYGDYWKYLGQLNISDFTSYLTFLILGPILRLGLLGLLLSNFISKKPLRMTTIVMSSVLIFGLIAYMMNNNWTNLNTQVSIHFDPNLVLIPAIFGFFITSFSIVIFFEWIRNRNYQLMPIIGGSAFALLFIFLTWVASDLQLVFLGPQRYLSIPSFGVSIFIAGLLVLIFDKLRKLNSTKQIAWAVFLLLIPLIYINYQVANDFFNYELNYAGMRAEDQTSMKDSFRNLVPNINKKERSLFYFDETADHDNGYFDESTILAGFEFWTRVKPDGNVEYFPDPGMMRTNVQCPEHTHENCMKILKEGFATVNGEKGIWYKDTIRGQTTPRFYKLNNFYALRFINKDLVNIREEVLGNLK